MDNINNLKLLSVIIPAYNAEKYLVKCVDSVANQTYKNIEIIIVDDGSTDSTPQICDELASKYNNNVKVIHQSNQGPNKTRENGLKASTGEYIAFIDSDDYIDLTAYEKVIKALEENDCDIAQFGVNFVDLDGKIIKDWRRDSIMFNSSHDIYLYFLTNIVPTWSLIDKVYKRSMLENLKWLKISCLEDYSVSAQIFAKAQKFITINNFLYNYVQNDNSLMHKGSMKSDSDALSASELVVKLTHENFPEFLPEAIWHKIVLYHINVCSAMDYSDKQIVKQNVQSLLTDYKQMSLELKKQGRKLYIAKKMKLKQNMKIWLLVYCPNLYKVYLTTRLKIHALTGI